jgi:putative membrane protein
MQVGRPRSKLKARQTLFPVPHRNTPEKTCARPQQAGAPVKRRDEMTAKRFTIRLAAYSAAALLASATLIAQAPGGGSPMPQQPTQPTQPAQPGMTSQQGGTSPDTSAQGMADHAFVSDAMQGNLGEIQLAQLAQQKSQSQDVKQFAQKLAADHSQMNQKWFEPEAKQLDISVPKGPSKKDKKLMSKLQGLTGAEFDKEYITAMVKDHKDDLKKFKEEAEASQDPTLKQVAQQGTGVITQHLQIAEKVAQNHNIPVDQSGKDVSSAK